MKRVTMGHGAGGETMQGFILDHIVTRFPDSGAEVPLRAFDDASVIDDIVFTTDGHTVKPLIFPGGDIGSLSVAGTVNDIAVIGGEPIGLSCALVIEEGLDMDVVDTVMGSIGDSSSACGVPICTGDTKVVGTGDIDEMVVVTSAVGRRSPYLDGCLEVARQHRDVSNRWLTDDGVREGDAIIASGNMGDHGIAILSFREGYGFESDVVSDVAPLNRMIASALEVGGVTVMKDPTRGGLANTLNEWASKSNVGIEIEESAIPRSEGAINAADLLGIDLLSIGNEGKVVVSCVPEMAEEVVEALRRHPEGRHAAIIGHATGEYDRVVMRTEVGGKRILEPPVGDPVPRIC